MVTADLPAVRELAHEHGGTVNDVVLAAVTRALRALLASREEQLGEVTISVLVSARRTGGGQLGNRLGNQVGIMPITVPADPDINADIDPDIDASGGGALAALGARVGRIAAITRERKSQDRGASRALLVPVFLLVARSGLLRLFVNHQRLIHTFVTNLRGPRLPLTVAGAPVRALLAIPATSGNVTVTFGVLSYAGTLRITVVSDPDQVPDVAVLTAALRRDLSMLTSAREGTFGPGP